MTSLIIPILVFLVFILLSMRLDRLRVKVHVLTQETIDKAVEIDDYTSEIYMRDEEIERLKQL